MFSMPPATATLILPSAISWAAETMACAPEPQTRLTVSAGTVTGSPACTAACRAGFHLGAGLHDIAHDDGFHLVGAKLGARDRSADRHGTEIGSRHVLEGAAKGTDCRADGFGKNNCA